MYRLAELADDLDLAAIDVARATNFFDGQVTCIGHRLTFRGVGVGKFGAFLVADEVLAVPDMEKITWQGCFRPALQIPNGAIIQRFLSFFGPDMQYWQTAKF